VSEQIDVNGALSATETVLRNLIASRLEQKFGTRWQDHLGVTPQRVELWKQRKAEEAVRLSTGNLETRLLYFADFTDIKTIVSKNWEVFTDVFGEKREFEVLISMLEDFRNPQAHRRGLLPFQEQLVAGICGEIRTRIARYRSRLETSDDCFPRIESAFDNHGQFHPRKSFQQPPILRVGDRIEVSVNASDPEGRPLQYFFVAYKDSRNVPNPPWQNDHTFSIELEESHITKSLTIGVMIRSDRTYHANVNYDDYVSFTYTVLPNQ
jgi:hypothetical protein